MRYEEIDYNGRKIKYKVFDYDTPEGWHEYIEATSGSIDDETFVVPADLPFAVEEGHVPQAIDALRMFQEQMKGEGEKAGFYSDEDVAEWITESRREEKILS